MEKPFYLPLCTKGLFWCFNSQAIQNPNDEALQEQAWAAVVPLVGKLKKFYEFSQRLGVYHLGLCLQEYYYVAQEK